MRIKSILNKYQENGGSLDGLKVRSAENSYEKALMLQVLKFNDVFEAVYEETAPHKLCAYIYELANEFNKFYHETKILSEEDEEKRAGYIALLVLAKRVLEKCIDLLGFEAPEDVYKRQALYRGGHLFKEQSAGCDQELRACIYHGGRDHVVCRNTCGRCV